MIMRFEPTPDVEKAVAASLSYLSSPDALHSIDQDPYWPKWHSPWWHMTLLWEMGLSPRIPQTAVKRMVAVLDVHYPKFFPRSENELPIGTDPHRGTACHCELGTIYQVLDDCGVDVDRELPWIRSWFLKYQLPDGGLNCANEAYVKISPKSSVVSTLPPLEAVLRHTHRPFNREEEEFLDRGASYLITHRLYRAAGSGKLIDSDWLKPCFPRFYDYDLLRGLSFLLRWAHMRSKTLPQEAVSEAWECLSTEASSGSLAPRRRCCEGDNTFLQAADGRWVKNPTPTTFPLLEAVSRVGVPSPYLTRIWRGAQDLSGC